MAGLHHLAEKLLSGALGRLASSGLPHFRGIYQNKRSCIKMLLEILFRIWKTRLQDSWANEGQS